jgi:hypothetical protein
MFTYRIHTYQSLYVTEFIISQFKCNKVYNQPLPSILYMYKYVNSLHVCQAVFLHLI